MPNVFTSYAHLQDRLKPALSIDEDVLKVLNFMNTSSESHIEASRLVAVAEQVALLAPLLWGHHERKEVCYPMIVTDDLIRISKFEDGLYEETRKFLKEARKKRKEEAIHPLPNC